MAETPKLNLNAVQPGLEKRPEVATLGALGQGVAEQVTAGRTKAEALIGTHFDFDHPKDDPDGFDAVINAWQGAGENLEKLWSLLSPETHLRDLDPPPLEAAAAYNDTEEKEPEGWANDKNDINFKDWKRGEHARDALAKNPTWLDHVNAASLKYAVPQYTIVGFIECESSFNPNIRPIDPKTGEQLSSAVGLSQAIKSTFEAYKKAGHPEADRATPADAIDFVGWYCKELVRQVDSIIKPGEEAYRLTVTDVHNLYRAYHDGPQGYVSARRYEANPSKKNFEALAWFQKRTKKDATGNAVYEFQLADAYAKRVSRVANAYHLISSPNA